MTPTQTQDFVLLAELGEHGFLLENTTDYEAACKRCQALYDWLAKVGDGQFRQWLRQQDYLHYYQLPRDADLMHTDFMCTNGLQTVAVLPVAKNVCLKTLVLERRQAMLRLHPRMGRLPNPQFMDGLCGGTGFSAN